MFKYIITNDSQVKGLNICSDDIGEYISVNHYIYICYSFSTFIFNFKVVEIVQLSFLYYI